MPETPENKPKEPKEGINSYLRYSGMAFQMLGIMVVAAFAGMRLDAYVGTANPWFTIVLLLLAVVASMVLVIVSLNKK